MEFFVYFCGIAVVFLWAKTRIDTLEAANAERDRRIAQLTERLFTLEQRGVAPKPAPQPQPQQQQQIAPAPPPPPIPMATAPPPTPLMPPPPEPKRDMEALIGGNWLSKLGVLILLIGLALFVAFALAGFGPTGRIAIGAVTSLSLLGAGIAFERKPDYRTLGVALIGGGWAGLYFTAFAAQKKAVADGANPRDVKFAFAGEIVERFHGRAAAEAAGRDFNARFREGALPEDDLDSYYKDEMTFERAEEDADDRGDEHGGERQLNGGGQLQANLVAHRETAGERAAQVVGASVEADRA